MVRVIFSRIIKNLFGENKPSCEIVADTAANDRQDAEWLKDGYSWIPDWKKIIGKEWSEWEKARVAAIGGPKVLIATAVGGNSILTPMETVFAVALTMRGAEVHFLLCDKILPACQNAYGTNKDTQMSFLANGPGQNMCQWCFDCGERSIGPLGLKVHKMSEYLSSDDFVMAKKIALSADVDSIGSFRYKDIDLGESVMSGTLRFYGRGDFDGEPYSEAVLRRFLEAGILSADAMFNLLKANSFQHIIVNQGFYVPQGVEVEVATKTNNHLVCWDISYRQRCITMSHSNTYYRTLVDTSIDDWNKQEWNSRLEEEITEYLVGRWTGAYDWMKFNERGAEEEPEELVRDLGLNPDIPIVGLLTNVVWDAQVYYPGNAFPNMLDWMLKTVDYFAERKDLQLLIRVHPAELKCWQKSRQFAEEEIRKVFPQLPDNVFIIPPQSEVNTYKAMMACDSVLIYATTAGLELSCMGIPTIISGEAWMRGKGIGLDVVSQEHYFSSLDSLPMGQRMTEDQISKAKKYAFHFYLRKMIDIGILEPMPFDNCPYRIPELGLESFKKGSDLGLDVVCDGILSGNEFIFPAERVTSKILS